MSHPAQSMADFELQATLRAWRRDRAAALGVPPYNVLTNRTLVEIARGRPDTEEALRAISGIGPRRADAFGREILDLVGGVAPPTVETSAALDAVQRMPDPRDVPPSSTAPVAPLPYRVAIEYHLEDEARQCLVDELSGAAGGALVGDLLSALRSGPARVCIRVEAQRGGPVS